MQKRLLIALGAVVGICSAQSIAAHDDPNMILIEARQGEMALRSYSVAPLFAMAKGKIPYDAEQATKLVNNLKVLQQFDLGDAWAAGTGKDKYPDETDALPKIWSTYPEIAEHGKEYKTAVEELAAVAGDGLEQLRSKIGDLGKACKGCHDEFREKE